MIVADSSYIVEGLLRDASLLESEPVVSPDLALYEVMNTLWKHESKLRDIPSAEPYIDCLLELLASRIIQFLRPDSTLVRRAYNLALKEGISFYDAIFIVLSVNLRLELKTYDETQRKIAVRLKRIR